MQPSEPFYGLTPNMTPNTFALAHQARFGPIRKERIEPFYDLTPNTNMMIPNTAPFSNAELCEPNWRLGQALNCYSESVNWLDSDSGLSVLSEAN